MPRNLDLPADNKTVKITTEDKFFTGFHTVNRLIISRKKKNMNSNLRRKSAKS